MKTNDLIARAELGEVIGDGRAQIEALLESRKYCRALIEELQKRVRELKLTVGDVPREELH